jgi:hypothetical protein
MYCIHCGKSNLGNASYCAFCGKLIGSSNAQPIQTPTEWEFAFFQKCWGKWDGDSWKLRSGITEYSIRLDLWGRHQSKFMPEIQKYIDSGWQPVSPPGPGSYEFKRADSEEISLKAFLVEFRRSAGPRTDKEKYLVGVWQEVGDLSVFSRLLSLKKSGFEFFKDRRFHYFDRSGEKHLEGIYFENSQAKIEMLYKFDPDLDGVINIVNDKLAVRYKHEKQAQQYERVK